MSNHRTDTHLAQIVDDGVHVLRTDGRFGAAHFMDLYGVQLRVIMRVLTPGAKYREPRSMRAPSSS